MLWQAIAYIPLSFDKERKGGHFLYLPVNEGLQEMRPHVFRDLILRCSVGDKWFTEGCFFAAAKEYNANARFE